YPRDSICICIADIRARTPNHKKKKSLDFNDSNVLEKFSLARPFNTVELSHNPNNGYRLQ
ncbi:MAG: hypothetical protein VX917_02485, partial [Chloroflexota bacterium]|nr:hypothetical protein [Chloroflexota bacterium]